MLNFYYLMYKYFFIFSILFPFLVQAQQTDWEKYDLKGKVKKVIANTSTYTGPCATTMKYAVYTCETTFNNKGYILQNTWKLGGRILQTQLFYYKRKKIQLIIQHFNDEGSPTYSKTYSYKKGKPSVLDTDLEMQDVFSYLFYKESILWKPKNATYDYIGNWLNKEKGNDHCLERNSRIIEYY
ncbi:MAG: hypothetical protein Q3983_09030 [Capnocytophaga sp.]|nr:hypothetical protein [Capnocytophaga sp.]